MNQQRTGVPKWPLWIVPSMATMYVFLVYLVLGLRGSWGYYALPGPLRLVLVPADLFLRTVVDPGYRVYYLRIYSFWEVWHVVVLWEGAAIIVGLTLYGLIGLIDLIVPEDQQTQGGH